MSNASFSSGSRHGRICRPMWEFNIQYMALWVPAVGRWETLFPGASELMTNAVCVRVAPVKLVKHRTDGNSRSEIYIPNLLRLPVYRLALQPLAKGSC